jgi:hypothetical protein
MKNDGYGSFFTDGPELIPICNPLDPGIYFSIDAVPHPINAG